MYEAALTRVEKIKPIHKKVAGYSKDLEDRAVAKEGAGELPPVFSQTSQPIWGSDLNFSELSLYLISNNMSPVF